jgi:hypothetical protein
LPARLSASARRRGSCVLVSSHVLAEVDQIADDVLIVARGGLVRAVSLGELRREPVFATGVRSAEVERLRALLAVAGYAAGRGSSCTAYPRSGASKRSSSREPALTAGSGPVCSRHRSRRRAAGDRNLPGRARPPPSPRREGAGLGCRRSGAGRCDADARRCPQRLRHRSAWRHAEVVRRGTGGDRGSRSDDGALRADRRRPRSAAPQPDRRRRRRPAVGARRSSATSLAPLLRRPYTCGAFVVWRSPRLRNPQHPLASGARGPQQIFPRFAPRPCPTGASPFAPVTHRSSTGASARW